MMYVYVCHMGETDIHIWYNVYLVVYVRLGCFNRLNVGVVAIVSFKTHK